MSLKDEGKVTYWINSLNIFALAYIYYTFTSRSYTNCTTSQPNIVEDSSTSQSVASVSSNEEDESANKQHAHNIKHFNKENIAPKIKKRKVNETKELEQTLIQMSQKISTYMEKKVSTADDAFMEFIKTEFNNIPETEKNIRRKMIMDALIVPLPKK